METAIIWATISTITAISGWIVAFVTQRQKSKQEIRAIIAETQRDRLDHTFKTYKKRMSARLEAQTNAISTLKDVALNSGGDPRNALSALASSLLQPEDSDSSSEDSELPSEGETAESSDGSPNEEVRSWRELLGSLLGGGDGKVRIPSSGLDERG